MPSATIAIPAELRNNCIYKLPHESRLTNRCLRQCLKSIAAFHSICAEIFHALTLRLRFAFFYTHRSDSRKRPSAKPMEDRRRHYTRTSRLSSGGRPRVLRLAHQRGGRDPGRRSEEQTSELQSQM